MEKAIFFFFTLSLGLSASAAKWNPRAPLKDPQSLHSLILSSEANGVNHFIADDCQQAISKFIKSGKDFSSKKVLKYSLTMERFPVKEVRSREFFHYTDSSGAAAIVQAKKYSEIFKFLRKSDRSPSQSWLLYAAADVNSSKSFGHILVKIRFLPHALIFLPNGDLPGTEAKGKRDVNREIEDELIAKDEALEACRSGDDVTDSMNESILVLLAAEADDVSALAYYGINNQFFRPGDQWVQILDSWTIQSASVENH